MKQLKLHRPSPAMVVAIIACVLALGGSAVVAKKKKKTAPKNSVVTKSIKGAAVTTPKLKDGAVTAPKLTAGEQSQGFQARQDGEIPLPAATDTTVGTLSLPAGGKYFVSAEVSVGKNATTQVRCTLKSGGTTLTQGDALVNGAADYTHTITLIGFADGGAATLSCNAAAAASARNRVIDAIRVGSVTG